MATHRSFFHAGGRTPALRRALRDDELLSLRCAAGAVVRVLRGRAWITTHGDPVDHVLTRGQQVVVRRAGAVVVNAIEPTVVAVGHPDDLAEVADRKLHDKYNAMQARHPADTTHA